MQSPAALPNALPLELAVDQDPRQELQRPPEPRSPIGLMALLGTSESATRELLCLWQGHIRPSCAVAWEHLSQAPHLSFEHLQLLDACLGTLQLVASSTGHACLIGQQHPYAAAAQSVFIESRHLLQAICSDQALYMALSESCERSEAAPSDGSSTYAGRQVTPSQKQLCLQLLHHMQQQSQIPLVRSSMCDSKCAALFSAVTQTPSQHARSLSCSYGHVAREPATMLNRGCKSSF